jgi:WhiB family redox-sensing transcriptional regulator
MPFLPVLTKLMYAKNDEKMADIKDTLDMIIIPDWHKDAACRGHRIPDLWFPEPGDPLTGIRTARALWICSRCPVREECLDEAVKKNEKHGIRGGKTTRQRKRMVKS